MHYKWPFSLAMLVYQRVPLLESTNSIAPNSFGLNALPVFRSLDFPLCLTGHTGNSAFCTGDEQLRSAVKVSLFQQKKGVFLSSLNITHVHDFHEFSWIFHVFSWYSHNPLAAQLISRPSHELRIGMDVFFPRGPRMSMGSTNWFHPATSHTACNPAVLQAATAK